MRQFKICLKTTTLCETTKPILPLPSHNFWKLLTTNEVACVHHLVILLTGGGRSPKWSITYYALGLTTQGDPRTRDSLYRKPSGSRSSSPWTWHLTQLLHYEPGKQAVRIIQECFLVASNVTWAFISDISNLFTQFGTRLTLKHAGSTWA